MIIIIFGCYSLFANPMNNKIFDIEILDIRWLDNMPEELDQCAHGQIRIRIGKEIIVDKQEKSKLWTLSAMAIHLLRTAEQNHTKKSLVSEHLIPCCGHHIDHIEGQLDVHIQGCMTGINYWVEHQSNFVKITSEKGTEIKISRQEYLNEIIDFVDKDEKFYKTSKPKIEPENEYDRIGIRKYWEEWTRRRISLASKK